MTPPVTTPTRSDSFAAHPQFPWLRPDDLSLPMLPDQAMRALQLTSDPELTVTKLAGVVSKDPVLATRVLGLANSAMFGALSPLRSVQDAVVRLGTGCVRNVVVTVSMHAQMAAPDLYGTEGRRFMDHAIGTAYLARLIADRLDADVEEAFLTGLLHDIGKLVVLKTAHAHQRREGATIYPEELAAAITAVHAQCGALALHFWRLPDEVLDAVRHHHDYTLAVDRRAAAICYAANRLSHRYGFGCTPEGDDAKSDPVWKEFGLDEAWLEETDAHAPGLFNAARQTLG